MLFTFATNVFPSFDNSDQSSIKRHKPKKRGGRKSGEREPNQQLISRFTTPSVASGHSGECLGVILFFFSYWFPFVSLSKIPESPVGALVSACPRNWFWNLLNILVSCQEGKNECLLSQNAQRHSALSQKLNLKPVVLLLFGIHKQTATNFMYIFLLLTFIDIWNIEYPQWFLFFSEGDASKWLWSSFMYGSSLQPAPCGCSQREQTPMKMRRIFYCPKIHVAQSEPHAQLNKQTNNLFLYGKAKTTLTTMVWGEWGCYFGVN